MEDEPERAPLAGPDHRHPVPYWGGRPSARRSDRPIPGREQVSVSVRQQRGGAARLRPRALLEEQELAPGVVDARLVQVDDDL